MQTADHSVQGSSCDCQSVDSFEDFSSILTSAAAAGTTLVRLCPFEIEKSNLEEGLTLSNVSNLHVQCAKESRDDECLITGIGNSGSISTIHYEVLYLTETDSLTFQGLTFRSVNKGVIRARASTNLQIIDGLFEYNQSPPNKTGAIVEIMDAASTAYLVDSEFRSNNGGAVQNSGFLTITHCLFQDNAATPEWISNDETETRGGGAGGAILNTQNAHLMLYDSSFIDNATDKSGPAVYSYDVGTVDLGSNCGNGNRVVENTQAEVEVILGYCDGIYYRYTADGTERQCATFGGACSA